MHLMHVNCMLSLENNIYIHIHIQNDVIIYYLSTYKSTYYLSTYKSTYYRKK